MCHQEITNQTQEKHIRKKKHKDFKDQVIWQIWWGKYSVFVSLSRSMNDF